MAVKKTENKTAKRAPRKKAASKQEEVILATPEMKDFPSVRIGSKETGCITLLQTNLKHRGFYDGIVDGKFGPKTEQAVMDFQKAIGKPLNGSVGPKTWEALQNSPVRKEQPAPEPEPAPAQLPQTGPGTRVLIEGLSRYQAELLVKLLAGNTECRIL